MRRREDERDGLFEVRPARVGQGPDGPRGVGHVGVAEQNESIESLPAHHGTESAPLVHAAYEQHPASGGMRVGGAEAISPAGIRRPARGSA